MNSPERQEQFRIANALRVYIGDAKVTEPVTDVKRRWPFAAMSLAAAAVVIAALVWIWPGSTGKSYNAVLTPGGQTREGGTAQQQITIPAGTDTLELDLKLTRNDFQKYRATLLNSEGGTIQIKELTGPTLRFSVRTQQIPSGEYQLKVDGINPNGTSESADSYRFSIKN